LFLLPAALLLSTFLPSAITPLLMVGGLYLAYEGAEKVFHRMSGNASGHAALAMLAPGADAKALEDQRVAGAIRTDFILSAEIMAIALANITATDLVTQSLVLACVGILVTLFVYGLVALIVKADDLGVHLAQRNGPISGLAGRALVKGVPPFLRLLSVIGTLAMLWVGGGILLHGAEAYGFAQPTEAIHAAAEAVSAALPAGGGAIGWIVGAAGAALVGLAIGAAALLMVAIVSAPFRRAKAPQS
jgi:predicted DNA repair protein MutK